MQRIHQVTTPDLKVHINQDAPPFQQPRVRRGMAKKPDARGHQCKAVKRDARAPTQTGEAQLITCPLVHYLRSNPSAYPPVFHVSSLNLEGKLNWCIKHNNTPIQVFLLNLSGKLCCSFVTLLWDIYFFLRNVKHTRINCTNLKKNEKK